MKKLSILALLLSLVLCFSVVLTACDGGEIPDEPDDGENENKDPDEGNKPEDTAYVITITDMNGEGVAGVSVQLCDANNCRLIRTPSDANGVIRAEDLPDPVGGVYKMQFVVVPEGYENMYPNSGTEYIYFEEGSRTLEVILPYTIGSTPEVPIAVTDDQTYTVEAGKKVYFILRGQYPAVLRGLTADCVAEMGEDTLAIEDGILEITPAIAEVGVTMTYFSIQNNGVTDVTFTSAIMVPLGAMENPQIVAAEGGEATVSNNRAYYLSYTATAAGTLRITVTEESGEVTVNNLTSFVYGNASTEDVIEVTVAAGDELQIIADSTSEDAEITYTVELTFVQ